MRYQEQSHSGSGSGSASSCSGSGTSWFRFVLTVVRPEKLSRQDLSTVHSSSASFQVHSFKDDKHLQIQDFPLFQMSSRSSMMTEMKFLMSIQVSWLRSS